MKRSVWQKAIQACADPQRARRFLDQLQATSASNVLPAASAEQARVLTALFSGSQALSELLMKRPDWLVATLEVERLQHPRREQGLRREVNAWLRPLLDKREYAAALAGLREFKQREMLRIASRDLARLGNVIEITGELSSIADVCLETVFQICRRQFTERFGWPHHPDADGQWHRTAFCVFGLGKLGGSELNYSSDVDLIFVYEDEGCSFKKPPAKSNRGVKGLATHQFFKHFIEAFVAEVTRLTPEGTLYRVDLRLRPEGDTGPLARSLAGYENYYAQWGQTWERMMLVKARCVAGDAALASEFLEMTQPFRHPRSIGEQTVREIAGMKQRIESEVVKSGEIDRNVKLGRGGIREVEFVAQTLQLLHAGRIPFLQGAQTLPLLGKLVQYNLLSSEDAAALSCAYSFLRDIEHRLQMENNLQTHTIPSERMVRERLAKLMGFATARTFEAALRKHADNVRRVYDSMLGTGPALKTGLPREFTGNETNWKKILADHSFKDVDRSFRMLETFASGPGYIHVSTRTTDLAMQLLPRLFALCPREKEDGKIVMPKNALSDPDRVLARLDSYITAYGARATLYETWASNPSLFDLLLLLFDRSEFLAETAIRTPDLVDELELSGFLRRRKTAAQILEDLRHGKQDSNQKLWLRRYHETELMRLGLRDILGLADFEQNLVELSALGDACLQYALEIIMRQHRLKEPPFALIGLGKLGGSELTYGSDLDIMFVAAIKTKNLSSLHKLAAEIMDLLSSPTEMGVAFATDARLRPDGEKGLLVNTLGAYEEYYRHRAMLWEIQSLTRARPVAGDLETSEHFQHLAAKLTDFARPSLPLAAFDPNWKSRIARMRQRIEKERTPPGKNALAIKTGTGGLMDAEFIAQTLCLAGGWQEPNTLRALQLARENKALAAPDADSLIENYRKLRRIEGVLRRWSYEGETVLPDDPAPFYRVAVRCGFAEADSFEKAIGEYRAAIRAVYTKAMK